MPLEEILDFQGGIKRLTKENMEKLKESILKYGFAAPVFIWATKKGITKKCLDGHQRAKILLHLKREGYEIPEVPVDYIYADTEKEAKEILLHISSQYGQWVAQQLDIYMIEAKIDALEISRTVVIDELNVGCWDPDIDYIAGIEENEQGILAKIKVVCYQEDRDDLKRQLISFLAQSGFKGIEIE